MNFSNSSEIKDVKDLNNVYKKNPNSNFKTLGNWKSSRNSSISIYPSLNKEKRKKFLDDELPEDKVEPYKSKSSLRKKILNKNNSSRSSISFMPNENDNESKTKEQASSKLFK